MIDTAVIVRRLERLREYVGYLRELRSKSKQDFINDPFIYGNAERYLQLSIQCMLDIGNHIIVGEQLVRPEEYRDIFALLGKNGVLSPDFASALQPLAGLRNLLVHDYLEVDRSEIYRLLHEQLKDIDRFIRAIAKYMN